MAKPKKEEVVVREVLEDGVVREGKENPIDRIQTEEKVRTKGNWKKATFEEMAALEAAGKLIGYDPKTGEVLVK